VIGNNPSFFFYMTYSLPSGTPGARDTFEGLLPNVRRAGVFDPTQWLNAGRPLGPTTLLVKGLHFDIPSGPTDSAESWLDQHCTLQNAERLVHDSGARWKQRFAPQTGQLDWRIEIRSYSCPWLERTPKIREPRIRAPSSFASWSSGFSYRYAAL